MRRSNKPSYYLEFTGVILFLTLLAYLFSTAEPRHALQTVFSPRSASSSPPAAQVEAPSRHDGASPVNATAPSRDAFGIARSGFHVQTHRVEKNETFAELLTARGVPYQRVVHLARKARKVFDVRRLQTGKPYHIYRKKKTASGEPSDAPVRYLVYKRDPVHYVVFGLGDSLLVRSGERPVTTVPQVATGTIDHSLYDALDRADAPLTLATDLSKVFAWQVDFYRIQTGDRFKVIYEEERVGDEVVGTGRILGARLDHADTTFYGLYLDRSKQQGYFDEHGGSLEKALLQVPLEYSRISSRYTKRRFHPVQKRWKEHLGTDYAAAPGTPVYSVGDGTVIEAHRERYNGNFVKIRHNKTYTTQYLHFSRIAGGIEPGAAVEQGQTIGYVGSTGLATGPHLCYRFWKNGRQVDPYKQKLPSAAPVRPEYRLAYNRLKHRMLPRLRPADPAADQEAPLTAARRPMDRASLLSSLLRSSSFPGLWSGQRYDQHQLRK